MLSAHKSFDVAEFNETIEKAYLAGRREPSDRAKISFAPSGIGYGAGKCPRQWYYAFSGGIMREEDTDAMGVANMAYGVEAHERIQKLFDEAGILIAKEIKVTHNDPPIFGYVDLLVRWQDDSVVGEIKTTTQENFIFRKTSMRPQGYHLIQVLIYMWVMSKEKGFLFYENKNTQEFLTIPITWTETNKELLENTLEWMRIVKTNQESGQLPKRPFTRKSIACKSCAFAKHCWNDEEGTVEISPLEIPK